MKRYMRGLVALITSLAFMGGVASADTGCQGATITNTGPGSNSTVTCVDSSTVHVTCTNNIYAVNDNSQSSNSGNGTGGGNTTSGSVTTGNATNENGATVQIGASCAPAATTTTPSSAPTPTPTPTSPQPVTGLGGRGAGAPEGAAVATLPNTSNNPIMDIALVSAITLATTLILSRLGVLAYRRSVLK